MKGERDIKQLRDPETETANLVVTRHDGTVFDIIVTLTISNEDDIPIVFVDTEFDPPEHGLRVRLNDALATEWDMVPA